MHEMPNIKAGSFCDLMESYKEADAAQACPHIQPQYVFNQL